MIRRLRRFLEGVMATGALTAVWPALAQQLTLDAWEETDALCQVPLEQATMPSIRLYHVCR